jgi:hypothetical protein
MEEQDLDFDIVFSNPKGKAKKTAPPVEEDFDFDIVQSSAPIKKKNPLATGGPSIQAKPKSSLGLGGQVITGPSVSMPKQPKTVEGQQQVSALDDLWNTFKGSGLNTLANIAKVPEMAQTYALDLVTTAMGMNDEFNRLPAAAKKEIRNAVNSTSKVSPLPNVQLSNQAADYLNKRSEEVYQKTRKEEGDIVDEISNFTNNPSIEGVGNILYRGLKSTVESVPFMAGYALSPALVGIAAASGKRAEDLDKTGGNLGLNYLLNSNITGGTEVFAQGVTNKIMGRAAKAAFGNPKAAEILGTGYKNLIVKEIGKDMGEDFVAEGVTKATQDISDDVLNGRDVDWWGVGRRALNAGITGAVSAGTIRTGGEVVGGAKNYLASQIMPKADKEKIDNNIKTIGELNTQKGDDINPEVNKVIDNKIKELETQNTSMVSVAQSAVDNLTDDQIKQVVSIDDQLYENYNKAKAIFDDESMDQDAKDLLLKDLLEKKNQLNEQKDAIQKQATSEVPIQPEAGVSGEVAQGEPQAEPQVPAEEVKAEEVVSLKPEDISFGTAYDIQSATAEETTGKEKDKWGDAQVWRERIENSGDILRELSSRGERPDPGYLLEKVNKLKNWIKSNKKYPSEPIPDDIKTIDDFNKTDLRFTNTVDSYEYLNKFYPDLLEKIKKQYEEIPTYTKEQRLAVDLVLDLINNNFDGLESKLNDIENIANKIKQDGKLEIIPDVKLGKSTQEISGKTITPTEPISEEQKTEQVNAVQKGIDAVDKALKRGRPRAEAIKGGISFMQKTIAYEEADDTTREQMLRDINKKFGVKEKKAPTAKKILGEKTTKETVVIDVAKEIKKRLSDLDAAEQTGRRIGYKKGTSESDQAKKEVLDYINSLKINNKISGSQHKVIINTLKTNLRNPVIRKRAEDKIERVIKNANYAQSLVDAQKLRGRIRKTLKTGKEIADVEKSVRDFLKIDPKIVDNIDEYTNRANEIFNAIRNVQIKEGEVIAKKAIDLAAINEYSAKQSDIQEELNKNSLLNKYDELVDNESISGDMSLDEIRAYIESIEEDPKKADTNKSDKVRKFTKEAFADLSETVKQMIEDGEIDKQDVDFDLINKFADMDIEALSIDKQLYAVDSLDNFIKNGITSRMGAIYMSYKGLEESYADKESGLVARPLSYGLIGRLSYLKNITDKAIIGNILSGIAGIGDIYNNLEAIYISKTDSLITGVFRSPSKAIKFLKHSGFAGVVRGFVEGKKIVNDFANKYSEKYDKTKPNGIDFKSASNIYERGIFADLSRTILNGTPAQIQVEFNRNMKQLRLTIDELRKTNKKDSIRKADLYDSIYQKIKDTKNIEEVKQFIDPINQEAVKDMQDMWKKYYPEFRQMVADYYNILLDEDANYSPQMYEKLLEELSDDLLTKGSFKMGFDVISTEKVGTLKKNQKIDGLPTNKKNEINRVRDYDFDYNNISALEKTLIDVRTTPFVQQFTGYTDSPAYKEIFPDFDDRQMITKRLNFNINALRERQDTYSGKWAKKINNVISSLSKYGTRIGLGSLSSAPKQSIPMVTNTAINMIGDLESFGMSFKDIFDKDAISFLDNSGYGISLRGSEAQTSIDYAEKLVEKASKGTSGKLIEASSKLVDQFSKLGDKYIELFLKNPDVFVANMAWLGYYRAKLKASGVDMSTFDWANHELNEEAADYAEFMVQDQQNMNISELGGKLLASKDATSKITRQLLFPFASYQFNLKDKNNRNITILTSKTSSIQDKIQAGKSLASGMVESYSFQTIQNLIGGMLLASAYAAIGYDEPEDEKTDGILDAIGKAMPFVRSTSTREKFNDKMFIGKSIFEFVMPIPNQLEYVTLLKLNELLDSIQGGSPEEQIKKKKAEAKAAEQVELDIMGKPIRKKRGPKKSEAEKKEEKRQERLSEPFRFYAKKDMPYEDVLTDIVGGVPSVGYEALGAWYASAKEANAGSYKDKYGNEYTYSDEQKKILGLALIPRAMVAMNIAPREFLTIGNNIEKAVKEKAKEDSKAAKAKAKPGKVLF